MNEKVSRQLVIGEHKVRLIPITRKKIDFELVDKNGLKVTKKQLQRAKYEYRNSKGELIEKIYKSNNGKIMKPFEKSDFIVAYVEVDKKSVFDLIAEKSYLAVCDSELKKELKNKSFRFNLIVSRSFKPYIAFMYENYGKVFVRCGFCFEKDIKAVTPQTQELEVVGETPELENVLGV